MNRTGYKEVLVMLTISSLCFLIGCGKKETTIAGPPAAAPAPVPVGPLPPVCIPINAQIPFTATNIRFTGLTIAGGLIPPGPNSHPDFPGGQAVGQVMMGGAVAGGPYQKTAIDGTISMNITPSQSPPPVAPPGASPPPPYTPFGGGGYLPPLPGYPYAPYPGAQQGTANAVGYLVISPATQQDILFRFGGGGYPSYPSAYPSAYPPTYPPGIGGPYPYPYPGPTPTTNVQTCASGMAFVGGHRDYQIYGMVIYLYVNNTQHGYKLNFGSN